MTTSASRGFALSGLRRLFVAFTVAGALLVSSAGVASAQNWSFVDPKGDVRTGTWEDDATTVSPNRKAGDVWRTSISHTRSKVVIRINMRAVPKNWVGSATIRTPRTSFDLTQFKVDGFGGLSFSKTNGYGKEVRCKGKSSRIVGTALVLTVPRKCLGNPRTVRVAVGVIVLEGEDTIHMDDALRRGIGNDLRLSPAIRRG